MKRLLVPLLCWAWLAGCHAGEPAAPDPSRAEASGPTVLDRWNELMRKAHEHAGSIENFGQPRTVPRGSRPEVVLRGEQVLIDGKPVVVGPGSTLQAWREALAGTPRCKEDDQSRVCDWDGAGMSVWADRTTARVVQFQIRLNIRPSEAHLSQSDRDSTPQHPFPGYLELDGYGIDAQTKFWEIRKMADPKRNLRCGLRECSHPHGRFSDKASLYLRLDRGDEQGRVYEFTIAE